MAITDDTRLAIKVCRLYYEENLSQKEISYQLGISRPQISRMLTHARRNNLVTIKINDPFADETRLEQYLTKHFKLRDALVLNTQGAQDSSDGRREEFGQMAAAYLEAYISDGNRVGVMSGQTISSVTRYIRHLNRKALEFVPLVGGMGTAGSGWHANAIVRSLADASGGTCCILNAPFVVQSAEAREVLLREPEISSILEMGARCDIALVGIGQVNTRSTTVLAGTLGDSDIQELLQGGAAASVCASYLNEDGEVLYTRIGERCIGQTLEDIRESRTIALAIGRSKVGAIAAALRGGHVDVLITDLETAAGIANLEDDQAKQAGSE